MEYRKLGWTDLNLTTIGLGTWAIGGGDWSFSWGPQDDKESLATISLAIEKGINWVDTAPAYGLGHSEEIVGKALKHLQRKPIIATKCGITWNKERKTSRQLSGKNIRQEVEASLKRLGVDVIDLYQIHWPDPDSELESAWQQISNTVKEGKVRYAGVCNCSIGQLKRIQPIHPVASLQPPYSMIERGAEDIGLLDYCREHNIGVVVYSPMQKGLLTGKFTRQRIEQLPEDDHRRKDPNFQEPRLSANLDLVENLQELARKRRITASQIAIAWVLRRPEVTAAIVGARRPSQVEETFLAGDLNLSDEDIKAINQIIAGHRKALNRV
ncbi:MAG: aldo/keto reductase [Dehalococcoidales bacterium]|nr:aldo/keto reductase [Dehalococcoidales bacterium]